MPPEHGGGVPALAIRRLKAGTGVAVMAVNGYLTQERPSPEADWLEVLATHYPASPWHLVEWDATRLRDLAADLGRAWRARSRAFAMVGTAIGSWRLAQRQAARAGGLLAEHIARAPAGRKYVLLGHSLGAGVVYHALRALACHGGPPRVAAVHLLGGAVGGITRDDWQEAAAAVSDLVHNYFSVNDPILRFLYPSGQFAIGTPAIGRQAMACGSGKIVDHDVSRHVTNHRSFKTAAARFLCVP